MMRLKSPNCLRHNPQLRPLFTTKVYLYQYQNKGIERNSSHMNNGM